MRTIRTSSNDHDGQPQRVVMRFLAICVSEVRCLRIVWSYRGSRGLRPYFYKRVRQTCVRRRSGVRDRENAFSASPHHARVRAHRAPPARARARSPRHARARIGLLTFLRAFLSPLRALNREFAHRWYVCTGRGCFHAIQLEILVRMVHVPSLDVSRASQTCLSASSCHTRATCACCFARELFKFRACALVCLVAWLFAWLLGCLLGCLVVVCYCLAQV